MTESDRILLQRYIDGTLDVAEGERVRLRIANSPEWQKAEEELLDDLASVVLLMAQIDRGAMMTEFDQLPPVVGHSEDMGGNRSGVSGLSSVTQGRRWLRAAAVLFVIGGGAAAVASRSKTTESTHDVATNPASVDSVSSSTDTNEAMRRPTPAFEESFAVSDYRIVGSTRRSARVDTIAEITVAVSTYEVSSGTEVTLEVTDASATGTRGGGSEQSVADTLGQYTVEDGKGYLLWYDQKAKRTFRISGRAKEAELRALKLRVRSNQ